MIFDGKPDYNILKTFREFNTDGKRRTWMFTANSIDCFPIYLSWLTVDFFNFKKTSSSPKWN